MCLRETSFIHMSINRTMYTHEEDGEDELSDYITQLNIQESCQESFLKSAARYHTTFQYNKNYTSSGTLVLLSKY